MNNIEQKLTYKYFNANTNIELFKDINNLLLELESIANISKYNLFIDRNGCVIFDVYYFLKKENCLQVLPNTTLKNC